MKNNKFLFIAMLIAPLGIIEGSLLTRENLGDFVAHYNGSDTLQLTVPNQFTMENGEADCGYQAIFNGCAVRNLLEMDEVARKDALEKLRSDKTDREKLFSSENSPWRSHVIRSSKEETDGNWIESIQLHSLLRDCARVDLSTAFITGNNVLQPDIPLSQDPLLYTSDEFANFVFAFRDDQGSATATFYVYLKGLSAKSTIISPNESNMVTLKNTMSSYNHGHWICMVAHRVGNERQFIIADSADNTSRVEHYRIKELRALLLEGPDYATEADGRFAKWIAEARPAGPIAEKLFGSFQNSTPYKFSQEHPFSSAIICSFVACYLAKFLVETYKNRADKTTYRSPENKGASNTLALAVY
jgi:hypothetical protein